MAYYLGRDVKVYLTTESDEAQVDVSSNAVSAISAGGSTAAATGSITVDEVTSFVDEQTFVLVDTAGTTHTFTIKDDSNATSSNNVGLQGAMSAGGDDGNTAAAVKIAASINAGTCASTITATSSLAVVTLTQDVSGADGNTTITNTAASGDITVVDFTGGGNTFTDITDELTFIFHIVPDIDISGATNLICANKPVRVNFDATTSQIDVRVYGGTGSDYVELKSSAIPVNGETPTAIIVTFDKNLKAGNCKLFIDGRLEDQSGVAKSDMDSGANNNWASPDNAYVTGVPFRVGHDTNAFDGRIEEVVVYNKCLYPIVPSDGSFVFSKPIKEISNSSPIAHTARLFVKDYHNIRGSTSIEVASSSPVSWRKSSFRLVD